MSSRTSLRLQLMREQSMQQDQKQGDNSYLSGEHTVGMAGGGQISGSMPGSASLSNTSKTSPIIIQQPIRFTGKQLVHLPPQIIHVQSHGNEVDRRGFSAPGPGHALPQDLGGTPPKVFKQDGVGTSQQGSRNSPAELSPPGYADSPHSQHSASFTSAQSEIDDIHIIDEILSLEDEQNMRRQQNRNDLPSSYTYSHELNMGGSRPVSIEPGQSVPYSRQVSSSAPSSSVDIEGLVKQEIMREQEIDRDRRKKDIHNMIERRRRYNINDRIKELGMILPKTSADFRINDLKMNKGTILKASVDYIRQLQREHENLLRDQQQRSQLETQNRVMMQRIKELERHLQSHGVPMPTGSSLSVVLEQPTQSPVPTHSPVSRESGGMGGKAIKQEPLDDLPCNTSHGCPVPPAQVSPSYHTLKQSPGPGHQASSPSFSTMLEFSQLALDSHGYAAVPPSHMPQDPMGHHSRPHAGVFSSGMGGDTLETPPVFGTNTGGAPHFPHAQMTELMMDDGHSTNSPLLHPGDPMLSATGQPVNQMSPVQWDAATFSPDGGSGGTAGDHRMDMTS